MELAGLSPSTHLPANATDGESIAATLLGKPQAEKPFVYHEYCGPSENKGGWGQALRVGNMSGVCLGHNLASGWPVCTAATFLLYDLSTDLGQQTNIASSNPGVVASMLAQMKTVRVPGGYCGEPGPSPSPSPGPSPPPAPPGPPLPLSFLGGTWEQGEAKDAVEIVVPSGSKTAFTIGVVGHCCKWNTGTGVMAADGHTLQVNATGPDGFATTEIGHVANSNGILTISWDPDGGADKKWASWVRDLD